MHRTLVSAILLLTVTGCNFGSSEPTPAPTPTPVAANPPDVLPAVGTPVTPAPSATATSLNVPGRSGGMLGGADMVLPSGALADDFTLNLTAGSPVTIVLEGLNTFGTPPTRLDVMAMLIYGGNIVAVDDDSAGNLNSRIIFTPTATGPHTLRVTTFAPRRVEGGYHVQTLAGENPSAQYQ